ncbi:MAG: hypothetical protein HC921_14010 [Synechococcaceae cyanobacterium SM2_3_1]|nr:hypothetical protein [Synechococcaceae cyanobacterium SM2_3_1]
MPEVWIYRPIPQELDLYWLEGENYLRQEQSRYFPRIDVKGILPEWLMRAREQDAMTVEMEFCRWLRQHLDQMRS